MIKRSTIGSFSLKDIIITAGLFSFAVLLCFVLQALDTDMTFMPLIFVLSVLLTARFTSSYIYGIISSVVSVVAVNFVFTYPYFELNFSMTGYPITFVTFLATSLVVSMLTTRIKLQEKIKAEIEQEKMRSNLLRAVSHDIRTPLTSISGAASAYLENKDKLTEEKKCELVADIKDEAQWLIRTVENILSVTRMSGSTANIVKNPEIAEEIIAETVYKFKKQFPNANVKATVDDELLFVPMDAILIEQVLFNLLENALIHGKNTMEIILKAEKSGGNALFTVEDDGVGIDRSILPHLFDDYFVRTESQEADGKRNMGIGLSVCMSIVKAHGGMMNGENKKDAGAVFSFTLPIEPTGNN